MSFLVFLQCLLAACGGGGGGGDSNGAAASPPPPPPPVMSFQISTAVSGISYRVGITDHPQSLVNDATFGGAASGDCDGDGDIDLFITYGDGSSVVSPNGGGPNRLYLNQLRQGSPLVFVDTAAAANVAFTGGPDRNDRHSGPEFADMDGDGDLDLFLGGIYDDPNRIYRNDNGSCTFTDVTANSPGIQNMRAAHTIGAAFGDYDLDGRIDMFLTHWGTPDSTYQPPNPTETEHLWRNVSDSATGIRFVNVSAASGVTAAVWTTRIYGINQVEDYTFTPTFARIDGDVWPDIVVAADTSTGDGGTSQVLINNRDGTFRNATNDALRAAQFGMGSALGDIDADGDLDWFITSIFARGDAALTAWGNRLYRNDFDTSPGASFVDITGPSGTANGRWGWAACFADLDNDADLDIYHTNGWPLPYLNDDFRFDPSRVFINMGAGTFFDERATSLGLIDYADARGVICADFDEDGDIDLLQLTNDRSNSATLWENRRAAAGSNYLRVRLVGVPPNTAAAGARIFVTIAGRRQLREVSIGNNYISQNPTEQVFGLGSAATIDELRVEWPAVVASPGMPPSQPAPTVLQSHEIRQISTGTLVIRHPDLPQVP